jgi:hypothetical protein
MARLKTRQSARKPFPQGFAKVRLRLAREPGHPQGSDEHGYDLVLPLKPTGRIDKDQWKPHRDLCRVVHYRGSDEHDLGHLVHTAGGHWKIRYDIKFNEDDPEGFHFGDERFAAGEYVSIIEGDGAHTYRVITVERL